MNSLDQVDDQYRIQNIQNIQAIQQILTKIADVETKLIINMKDLNRVTKKFEKKMRDLSNQIKHIETHGRSSFEKIENTICAYMVYNFAFVLIIFCVCYGLH
jgi:hypothetical protein